MQLRILFDSLELVCYLIISPCTILFSFLDLLRMVKVPVEAADQQSLERAWFIMIRVSSEPGRDFTGWLLVGF